MRIKAGASNNAKAEVNSPKKLRPSYSCRKKHKRKRGPSVLRSLPNFEKQVSQGSLICQSLYEIDQRSLPEGAPQQLKNLRAALVNNTTKEFVIIMYTSMASLAEYFEELKLATDGASQDRKFTKCLINEVSTFPCTMPRFDEEFSMTHEAAQGVLKGLVTSTEYLQQGHLESFWLTPGLDTTCCNTKTQANEDEKSWDAKEVASSSPNQDIIKKHRSSENNSPRVYTHKKFYMEKLPASLEKEEILSESESSDEQNENNHNSTSTRKMPASSDDPHSKDAPPLQHTVDSNPGCQFTEDCKKKSQNLNASEQNQGIIRWGVRKKITARCRSNTFSDGSISNKDVHKQDQHEVPKIGHGLNTCKQVMATQILTHIGKRKMLKVPKLMEGRWSSERYKAAQLKLFEIMKDKGAVPGRPLLRPTLRVEARKHIGDTGLLDHLLKHMTDTVINDGERFRRRHNSEGAMEYWLENALLQDLRRQAGVDQYWIPPPGWKVGDIITNSKNEHMSSSQLTELKQLREEVEKLKSQLEYVCLHVGASLIESKRMPDFSLDSDFQSWKKIEEDITKSQERKDEPLGSREVFDCHKHYSQRSSLGKHLKAERENSLPTGIVQADAVADMHEIFEKIEVGAEQVDDQTGSKSGDEIIFFCKAARARSVEKTSDGLSKIKQVNSERKSSEFTLLKRSPRSETNKEFDDKENVVPVMQPCELMKGFQGWKKPQDSSQREVLSAKSVNMARSLCKSPTPC